MAELGADGRADKLANSGTNGSHADAVSHADTHADGTHHGSSELCIDD